MRLLQVGYVVIRHRDVPMVEFEISTQRCQGDCTESAQFQAGGESRLEYPFKTF